LNLLLLEPSEVDATGRVRLHGTRARHLLQVLKVAEGQAVRAGLVDGGIGQGRVIALDDQSVTLECAFGDTPPRPPVDLLLAVPRPKVLRRLWAQLAALGVGRIILTNAARVERNYFDTHVLDALTYRPLFIEGLQQARDTRVPLVSVHRQFRILVEDELDALSPDTQRIVADPAGATSAAAALERDSAARVLLAVGPEGGWNTFELDLLRAHGFTTIGLGPRTLRADTACLALLAIVHEGIRRL
jgi:RsmE family RNA methyltransferase